MQIYFYEQNNEIKFTKKQREFFYVLDISFNSWLEDCAIIKSKMKWTKEKFINFLNLYFLPKYEQQEIPEYLINKQKQIKKNEIDTKAEIYKRKMAKLLNF